jgi:hypothetical protein
LAQVAAPPPSMGQNAARTREARAPEKLERGPEAGLAAEEGGGDAQGTSKERRRRRAARRRRAGRARRESVELQRSSLEIPLALLTPVAA